MWAKTAAIALILAAAVTAQDDDAKKKDEEAKAKIADFKKELKTAKTDKDVSLKCIRYAGDVEYKGIVPKLANLFRHKEIDAAKEAVDSCAKIRSKDAIDPLLNLWKEMESIREEKPGKGGNDLGGGLGGVVGGGIGQSYQDEQLKRKRDLTPAVETALKKITNEEFKDLRAANDWWRKNKGSFKDLE